MSLELIRFNWDHLFKVFSTKDYAYICLISAEHAYHMSTRGDSYMNFFKNGRYCFINKDISTGFRRYAVALASKITSYDSGNYMDTKISEIASGKVDINDVLSSLKDPLTRYCLNLALEVYLDKGFSKNLYSSLYKERHKTREEAYNNGISDEELFTGKNIQRLGSTAIDSEYKVYDNKTVFGVLTDNDKWGYTPQSLQNSTTGSSKGSNTTLLDMVFKIQPDWIEYSPGLYFGYDRVPFLAADIGGGWSVPFYAVGIVCSKISLAYNKMAIEDKLTGGGVQSASSKLVLPILDIINKEFGLKGATTSSSSEGYNEDRLYDIMKMK